MGVFFVKERRCGGAGKIDVINNRRRIRYTHMVIDSDPTRRLIETNLCKVTFPSRANIISSYEPSDLGSHIVNFLRIYTAFCGIRRVALNHRA